MFVDGICDLHFVLLSKLLNMIFIEMMVHANGKKINRIYED